MKGAPSSSETSVLTRAARRNISEDGILHSHRREYLKSCMTEMLYTTFRFAKETVIAVNDTVEN
jgi:hypothetical protein